MSKNTRFTRCDQCRVAKQQCTQLTVTDRWGRSALIWLCSSCRSAARIALDRAGQRWY